METPKDFNDLMESKFVELEEAEKEKGRKRMEAHQKYAESCISLLRESIQLISDDKRYGYIFKIDPTFGQYRVRTNDSPGRMPSEILLKDNKVTIYLYYDDPSQIITPENFDENLVNELLEPYFVSVSFDEDTPDTVYMVKIEYNRNLKITSEVEERKAAKEKAKKEAAIKAFEAKMAAKETEETVPSRHGLK